MARAAVLRRDEISAEILVQGVPLPVLNALRRAMQLYVPTAAVEDVVFYENTTPIYDEIIAHRLAMLPVKSGAAIEKLKPPEECGKCFEESPEASPEELSKACQGCFTMLRFEGEAGSEPLTVRAGDLKPDDPEISPAYPEIPVTVIGPGQRLSFDARIRLGRGWEHVKWSPVTVAGVRSVARITVRKIPEDLIGQASKCAEACPVGILSLNREEGLIEVSDVYKCTLCMQCAKHCPPGSIDVRPSEDQHVIFYESGGQLGAREIAILASKVLISRLEQLINQVRALRGGRA